MSWVRVEVECLKKPEPTSILTRSHGFKPRWLPLVFRATEKATGRSPA